MPSRAANAASDKRAGRVRRTLLATLAAALLAAFPGCRRREPVQPTPQMDAAPAFWIRVRILNDVSECTLSILSTSRLVSHVASTSEPIHLEPFEEPAPLRMHQGRIRIGDFLFQDTELSIFPDGPHIFELNGRDYRGNLRLILDPDDNTFDAINWVPLEPYLAGVIGAEMPDYWESEALQAQAIAARTYCLYIKNRFGAGRHWDVGKTQAHQVYRGIAAESAQIWNAVNQTGGQVLVAETHDGATDIFPTYYSSVCGGHTEDAEKVFGKSTQAIPGVPCPYCEDVARNELFNWPEAQYGKREVSMRLQQRYPVLMNLQEIVEIVPIEQSHYPDFTRTTKFELIGSSDQTDWLRAEDLRLTIDPTGMKIKSAAFEIADLGARWGFRSGRGFGHGVGMCQCGAQGMAMLGRTAEQILAHYFPNSEIRSLYAPQDETL